MKSPYIERVTKEPWEAVLFPPRELATPEELLAASSAMLICVKEADEALLRLTNLDDVHEFTVNRNLAQHGLRELGPRLADIRASALEAAERETLVSVGEWLHVDRMGRIDAIVAETAAVPELYADDYLATRDVGIDVPGRDGPDFG